MKHNLKPGDDVYRVIEHPDGGWYVAKVKVKSASDRQITLEKPFPFHFGVRFKPLSIGILFFATAASALDRFIKDAESQIAHANGKIIEASKALSWARSEQRDLAGSNHG